jgi:hypothetical protein
MRDSGIWKEQNLDISKRDKSFYADVKFMLGMQDGKDVLDDIIQDIGG